MKPRHILMLAVLSLIWGASYLLIKYAAADLPEAWVVLTRAGLAGLTLWVYMRATQPHLLGQVRDALRRPWLALVFGLCAIGGPFLLITYGERTVPSGLAAVLIASSPIFIAILAPTVDPSERMSGLQWAGLAIGLGGVGLLVGVEQLHTLGALLGALAMIGAAALYAVGGFVLKRGYPGVSPVATSFISITAACVIVVPFAAVHLPAHVPGLRATLSLLALGVVGTAYAFVEYYRLIHDAGYGRASIVAYTIPPVALAYGAILLDERIGPATVGGMALILAGVYLVARGATRAPAGAAEAPTSAT